MEVSTTFNRHVLTVHRYRHIRASHLRAALLILLQRGTIFAALVFSLAAAVPPPAAAKSPTETLAKTVTVWTHEHVNSPQFEVLAGAAEEFNRTQQQYRVQLQSSLYRRYDRWVRSAAITGTLPCLLEFDGPYLYELVWSGYLRPLDGFASRQLLNDFLPSVLQQGTYHGRLYALGQFESGIALWANRRYLIQADVRIPTLEAPWTLAEFEEALQKLSALPGLDYAIDMGNLSSSGELYTYAYLPILRGFGGDLVNRQGDGSARNMLDGPQSVRAMSRLQHWFKQGWTKSDLDRAKTFRSGRSALSWVGHWVYHDFHNALGADLLVLPLPDLGQGVITGMGSWSWGISSTCRNPEGAWRFLDFLLSTREILRMTNSNGGIPARRTALAQSRLYSSRGPLTLFVKQLDAGLAIPRPATPAYGTVSNAFARAASRIMSGSDVETELRTAAGRIDDEIARHRGYPHP